CRSARGTTGAWRASRVGRGRPLGPQRASSGGTRPTAVVPLTGFKLSASFVISSPPSVELPAARALSRREEDQPNAARAWSPLLGPSYAELGQGRLGFVGAWGPARPGRSPP